MSIKNEIITKFYDEHGKTNKIAKDLEVRPSYVTKIIQNDSRYIKEKEERTRISKENRKEYKSNWAKSKREIYKDLDDFVKLQHRQASNELSEPKHIVSDMDLVKWIRDMFRYDKKSSDLVLKKKIIVPCDIPRRIGNVVNPKSIKVRKTVNL